jgi:hypothetical protein
MENTSIKYMLLWGMVKTVTITVIANINKTITVLKLNLILPFKDFSIAITPNKNIRGMIGSIYLP